MSIEKYIFYLFTVTLLSSIHFSLLSLYDLSINCKINLAICLFVVPHILGITPDNLPVLISLDFAIFKESWIADVEDAARVVLVSVITIRTTDATEGSGDAAEEDAGTGGEI